MIYLVDQGECLYHNISDSFPFEYAILEHELFIYLGIPQRLDHVYGYNVFHWEKKGKELLL